MEFIVRNKRTAGKYEFIDAHEVAIFFLGKDIDEWEVFVRFRNLSRSSVDLEDNLNKAISDAKSD